MSVPGPLEGIRVVELAGGLAGPHAGKLLADLGAQVTKVEPPGGDRARHAGPFKNDVPHPETSASFLWVNTNKRSVVGDLHTEEGRALLSGLLANADVLIEDLAPGKLAALGFAPAALMRDHPGLVICSITPFGQSGPYAHLPESDLLLQAMGGEMYVIGHPEREPLRLGEFALWHAGLAAAYAVMLAVLRAEATGHSEHIDLSIYETQAACKAGPQLALLGYAYTGVIRRRGGMVANIVSGMRPSSDGYISLSGGKRLPQLLQIVGRPDLAARPEVLGPVSKMPRDLIDEIEAAYREWAKQHTMRDAVDIAQQNRIEGGPIYTVADTLADPSFRGRGVWEHIEHPYAGGLDYPGRPFVMSASPRSKAQRAPLLDEHRAEVLRELAVPPAPHRREPAAGPPPLPLAGVRVIDLAIVWAGPFAAQLLAEWGAEVIRMEPITALQPQTRDLVAERAGKYATTPGVDPWNADSMFNSSSHNKRSFTGDIRTPEGREAFLRLVAISDVIVENNVPDTIDRLGINWDELHRVNPRLIFVRMPGFGLNGPYRDYRAMGSHIEAMTGHFSVRAYPDAPLDAAGGDVASDSTAGLTAAFATVVALRHRARTGEGQLVEAAQVDAFMGMMATDILDCQMNGRVPSARGNDHRSHAPHNVYRCVGDDRWVAIDVGTDQEWRSLCHVLGLGEAAADPRFATQPARWQHRRDLDAVLAPAIATWERWRLFEALTAACVPAGPVQDSGDCFHCRHLRARNWFRPLTRDDLGTFNHPGSLFRWTETPNPFWRAPVRLGEDNEYVYRDLLGYALPEYEALVEKGLVGTRFSAAVLKRD